MPEDRLVVAIARFTPISSGAEEEADNFPHRVEQKLREKQHEGLPLEIKRLSIKVSGDNEQERRDSAMSIGISRKGSAHIVLWGEVRKDEGELYVKPRLTVTGRLGKAHIEETELKEFTSYDPKHIKFKERLANEITDIVTLVYGFAYYKVGNWNRAIEIMDHVHSSCGYLYKGLSLIKRSHRVLSPQQDLRTAIETFEKTLGAVQWNLTTRADSLTWDAYLNRANALALLGSYSQPKEALVYLQESVKSYRAALQVYTNAEFPQDRAMTKANLGTALDVLGTLIDGKEGIKFIQESEKSYRDALQVYTKAEFPQDWAMTQANLGSALDDLGSRLDSKEGIKFIQESEKSYRDDLQVYTKAEFAQQWAMIQANLGITLTHLGIRMGAGEGIKLLRGAVEVHKAALQVYTKAEFPQQWAETNTNLGSPLDYLGIRIDGEEGIKLIRESVKAYQDALQVYTKAGFPQDWAMTKTNLGIALTNLGIRLGVSEGIWLLREAVEAHRDALQVRTRVELPLKWARTQTNLGIALIKLGFRIRGEEGVLYLNESIVCFDNALSIYDSTSYPESYREILDLKSKVKELIRVLESIRRR